MMSKSKLKIIGSIVGVTGFCVNIIGSIIDNLEKKELVNDITREVIDKIKNGELKI